MKYHACFSIKIPWFAIIEIHCGETKIVTPSIMHLEVFCVMLKFDKVDLPPISKLDTKFQHSMVLKWCSCNRTIYKVGFEHYIHIWNGFCFFYHWFFLKLQMLNVVITNHLLTSNLVIMDTACEGYNWVERSLMWIGFFLWVKNFKKHNQGIHKALLP